MNRGDAIVSLLKLALTTAGAGVVSAPALDALNAQIHLPVWVVPVTVIAAAGAGAALSLFFGDPLTTRRDLWGQTLGATAFGTALAVLVSDAFDWDWASKNMEMAAMMSAAMVRWFLPTIIDRGKQFIRDLKFSFSKKTEGGDK